MSDNYLLLVPKDPQLIPTAAAQQCLVDAVRILLPRDAEIEAELSVSVSEHVVFFDAGANFEQLACPNCHSDLPIDWWLDRMEQDFDGQGFRLDEMELPCCGCVATLNDLRYRWPQAFGRFSLSVLNPGRRLLTPSEIQALEAAAGVPIRVILRHI